MVVCSKLCSYGILFIILLLNVATGSRPQLQCSLRHCGREVERAIFGPLGPETTLGMSA